MLSRSELREKAMTIIYQISLYKKNKMEFDVDSVIKENLEVDNEFVKDLVYGVITSYDELGELANKYLKNWTIDRLDMTGASILRIALYEIKYMDTPDVVFLDPPRNGFTASFMEALSKLKPSRIIYVSCNPFTQARDLKVIEKYYSIEEIQPVDNFPFTDELECIVSLKRKQTQRR